ncbi:unnamed protein product [Somion occarium]|uniref:Alternative oxidase n=1 Tax=Somion occarium TaxID=3059160 RepID=A0ABP1DZH2_9APHY
MLRTSTLLRQVPVACRTLALAPASRRTFTSSLLRLKPALTSKGTDVSGSAGVEGLHRKDTPSATAVLETQSELRAVQVLHHEAKTFSDKIAVYFVRLLRWSFDLVSGYKHKPLPPNSNNMSLEELREGGYIMTEHAWLSRMLFLESIAGVPGMVAATLRHLRSLRLMRRDAGWIHTLLEEAENERMHLMTFMAVRKPSWFFRMLVLGAQGVFYNLFFFSYLVSPRTCHRFVGLLEEEAVVTYTRCIQEIEAGHVPKWENYPAPAIAIDYWRMKPDAKLLDVIYAVRSDESTHRFVNHSLANINPDKDVNPFALREPNMLVKGGKLAFERDEAEQYVEESLHMIDEGRQKHDDPQQSQHQQSQHRQA